MCDIFDDIEDFAMAGSLGETMADAENEHKKPIGGPLTEKEVLEGSYDKEVFGEIDKDSVDDIF